MVLIKGRGPLIDRVDDNGPNRDLSGRARDSVDRVQQQIRTEALPSLPLVNRQFTDSRNRYRVFGEALAQARRDVLECDSPGHQRVVPEDRVAARLWNQHIGPGVRTVQDTY